MIYKKAADCSYLEIQARERGAAALQASAAGTFELRKTKHKPALKPIFNRTGIMIVRIVDIPTNFPRKKA